VESFRINVERSRPMSHPKTISEGANVAPPILLKAFPILHWSSTSGRLDICFVTPEFDWCPFRARRDKTQFPRVNPGKPWANFSWPFGPRIPR
jgi:hypothetical protein